MLGSTLAETRSSWAALGDGIVCVATLGVFFGRLANYINGELFGHTAKTNLPWLIKFPGALFNNLCPESKTYPEAMRAAIEASSGQPRLALEQAYNTGFGGEQALTAAIRSSDAVKTAIEPFLLNRHPSQLYEGLLEGLLLFIPADHPQISLFPSCHRIADWHLFSSLCPWPHLCRTVPGS